MSSAHTPNAFLGSVALHALLVALILAFAWLTNKTPEEAPVIFELVQGDGDDYAATEAPALGSPELLEVKLPDIPDPPPLVSPVEAAPPEESPVVADAPPVEIPPTPPTPPPPPVKPVNMAKLVDRIADKRAANIEKQFKKEQKAAEARAAKEAAAKKKTMTKAEFDRLNKNQKTPSRKPPTSAPITPKRIDTAGIAGGVKGGSTASKSGASGTALTRAEIELSDAYTSLLRQRLKEAHQKPPGLSDLLQTTVSFRLTSSGTVTNVTIVSSSRNSEFDQSVLAAFRRITLPPPPSNLKTNDYTITFKMKEDL